MTLDMIVKEKINYVIQMVVVAQAGKQAIEAIL